MEDPKQTAIDEFLMGMTGAYNRPLRMDENELSERMGAIAKYLERFDAETIRAGWQEVTEKYKKSSLPTLGDISGVVGFVAARIRRERGEGAQKKREEKADDPAFANDQMPTEAGREACKGGYQVAFWEFCARNRRVPTGAEMGKMISKRDLAEARLHQIREQKPGEDPMERINTETIINAAKRAITSKRRRLCEMAGVEFDG